MTIANCSMTTSQHSIHEFRLDARTIVRESLPESHRVVLELFRRHLAPEWEIYARPYLNGLRPDFVLLNPNVGIGVFEVRDWDLKSPSDAAQPDSSKASEAGWPQIATAVTKSNPMSLAAAYRKEIFDLYCPRLPDEKGKWAITAGVILPFAASNDAKRCCEPFGSALREAPSNDIANREERFFPITGREEVEAGQIEAIFPEASRKKSYLMHPAAAADLRGWLVEPDFALEQRKLLPLDEKQRELAKSRTASGYRRIKGPAGSGKSLVLAARAARLLNEGKTILIVTFNITLWHYLLGLIVREVDGPGWMGRARFTHFHYWCKTVCREAGPDWGTRYRNLFSPREGKSGEVLNDQLPALAAVAAGQPGAERYDAILVDEGQDFRLAWWNALRQSLRPGGEMLLVADKTQDIYGTAAAWTEDAMRQAGFAGGPWTELRTGYRMPLAAQELARGFAEWFLPKAHADLPEPREPEMALERCAMRWVQCEAQTAVQSCVREIFGLMRQTGKAGLANTDIALLVDDTRTGRDVVSKLGEYRVWVIDTFRPDPPPELTKRDLWEAERWSAEMERRKKMRFFLCNARVKATTLHSFKGWEASLVVMHISHGKAAESLALIYAGLTRLKRNEAGSWLTIVCSAPELADYGRNWPNSIDETARRASKPGKQVA